jgi:hypothetical protein
MEGQAILALMAVLCLGMVTGSLITAGISALVIKHAAPMPPPPTTGVTDAMAALDAKFKAALPQLELQLEQLAALVKSATSAK